MTESYALRRKALKNMLWWGIFSIIMLFSGLTSAYLIRAKGGNWLKFQLPDGFYISTMIILISSATLYLAQKNIQKDRRKATTFFLLLTFFLGIAFLISQFLAWKELYQNGIVYAGKYSNPAGSFLYMLTALHLVHLLGGLIAIIVTTIKNILKKYSAADYLGIELLSIYWHFLDGLWIFLFLFLLYIH